MLGMWQRITLTEDYEQFTLMMNGAYEGRFQMNRNNVFNLLKAEIVEQLIPNLFMKSIDGGADEVDQAERDNCKDIVDSIREISLVAASILARLEQYSVAIVFIG